ncbi:Tn3 family transposase [Streptomyces maoxianensis]|uniref:Tn3 family transposase n=1 Tax=Streptomyces maoxianensis TaxID=1459942 RepID=A0ABV9FY95_9ACTN
MIRTVPLPRYLSDAPLRSRVTAATNKFEAFNGFSDWVRFGERGTVAANDPVEQEKDVKFTSLLANLVIFPLVMRRMPCRVPRVSPVTVPARSSCRRHAVRPVRHRPEAGHSRGGLPKCQSVRGSGFRAVRLHPHSQSTADPDQRPPDSNEVHCRSQVSSGSSSKMK